MGGVSKTTGILHVCRPILMVADGPPSLSVTFMSLRATEGNSHHSCVRFFSATNASGRRLVESVPASLEISKKRFDALAGWRSVAQRQARSQDNRNWHCSCDTVGG